MKCVIKRLMYSGNGFFRNRFKRKTSEALFIQQLQPTLNTQYMFVPLKTLD